MIPLSVAFISSPGAPHSHRYPDTQIPSAITFITKPCQLHLLAPQELLAPTNTTDTADTPLPKIPRYRRYPATEDIENDKMDRECKNGKRMTKWTENDKWIENEEMERE